jgi:rhodanese-related sulfurtransferase
MKKILVVAAVAIGVLVLARSGCSQDLKWSAVLKGVRAEFKDVKHITTDSLAARLENRAETPPILLDARTAVEYDISHIQGAIRVDPDNPQIDSLGIPADSPIVAYCSVGYRSSAVARALQKRGYTNVANLEGSLFKWANEGRPLVRDTETRGESIGTSDVHPYNALWGKLLEKQVPKAQ